jgi:hypothetical protein
MSSMAVATLSASASINAPFEAKVDPPFPWYGLLFEIVRKNFPKKGSSLFLKYSLID